MNDGCIEWLSNWLGCVLVWLCALYVLWAGTRDED